ncbi:hypothetical protein CANMA_000762 [Candida margitis]|uniref:uncharacterized protein n=1 Tax=Candida margitis TaxID=1775924 RepID=UPI0022275512|nr:uncharacterized protein CANMA_000762 [Candida margitis]KAI5970151.1 hypothetical protein CANMA_000762 [Candida margitis]
MKDKSLQLQDLPLELLLRVLPIDECLLNQPLEISIPWLNFMEPKRRFRLLAESGIGNARCGHKFDLELKYGKLIYVNFGTPVDSKYLKDYIIFDHNTIEDTIYEYPDFVRCLKIWTGDLDHDEYLWFAFAKVQSCHSRHLQDVVFTDGIELDPCTEIQLNCLILGSFCLPMQKSRKLFHHLREEFVSNLKHVEFDMTVQNFLKLKDVLKEITGECHKIAPTTLHIYLNLENNRTYPQKFPIEWITSIFNLQSVEEFSLHYYNKSTSIGYLNDWIEKMPHLKSLNLGFGNLNFSHLPRQLENSKANIQIKVDKKYFNSIQHKYNRCYWREKKFRDCVIVCRPGH